MDILQNKYVIENISKVGSVFFLSFIITFLLVPWIGRFAVLIGAVDLPPKLRSKNDRGLSTRIHDYIYPRLGGLAMVIAILITLAVSSGFSSISKGIVLGIIIITIAGLLDDKFNLSGRAQLLAQSLAAAMVVLSGISITSINLAGISLSFHWISGAIHLLQYTYNFIFPADILTILWIVGMINVINWVGGVDALNGSVTSIALITLILITLASGNIPLSLLIAIHLGGVLGVLPFNYNPGKIMYGSIGDFLNGFLLAIFAILGSTKWTASLVVLGMPIIDGLLVIYSRFKSQPELLKQPWKILQVSDKNHLHHRLLAAGYSKKTVVLVEISIMTLLSITAIYFSNIRKDYAELIIGMGIIFMSFSLIFFLKKRNERKQKFNSILNETKSPVATSREIPTVKVIFKDQKKEDEEKFIY